MAAPALPPPPLDTPLTQSDGTLSAPWARWFQQVWDKLRAL
jgi:hypothetical protein